MKETYSIVLFVLGVFFWFIAVSRIIIPFVQKRKRLNDTLHILRGKTIGVAFWNKNCTERDYSDLEAQILPKFKKLGLVCCPIDLNQIIEVVSNNQNPFHCKNLDIDLLIACEFESHIDLSGSKLDHSPEFKLWIAREYPDAFVNEDVVEHLFPKLYNKNISEIYQDYLAENGVAPLCFVHFEHSYSEKIKYRFYLFSRGWASSGFDIRTIDFENPRSHVERCMIESIEQFLLNDSSFYYLSRNNNTYAHELDQPKSIVE